MRGVVDYISLQAASLNSSQKKLIKSIQSKFSATLQIQDRAIQKAVKPYLEKLDQILSVTTESKGKPAQKPFQIVLQVAPPPANRKEFEANLQSVLAHFPRYQLHNDLSVFDSTFQSRPHDWNFDLMHRNLLHAFKKYEQFQVEDSSNLEALKEDIVSLLKVPVPIQMGIIMETSPADTHRLEMLIHLVDLISKGMPCILNRHFFQAHAKNFKLFPKLNLDGDVNIYVQKEGDLCVVIPKGKSLEELGFNPDNLEKSTGQHLIPSELPRNFSSLIH